MTLTTDVKTHVIVFHDKSRKHITKEQANFIFQASATSTVPAITTPQLGRITFSSIAKIITIDDFYEQYPNERPEKPYNTFEENYPEYSKGNQQIRKPTERAKELMKKGFVGYFTKERGLSQEQAENNFKDFISQKV